MATFARALAIAAEAHQDQLDKAGQPYVLHPIRMALRMGTEVERIVAVLHDVVEDTRWTFDDLEREGFSPEGVEALRCVAKLSPDEPYDAFIE